MKVPRAPIQGGSWASTGDEASRFARFSFRPHFFQHLGFRLARSVDAPPPVRLVETSVFVLELGLQGEKARTSQLSKISNFGPTIT